METVQQSTNMNSLDQNQVDLTTVTEHGTVIIVDISGFTQLVYETELLAGRNIVSSLLSSVVSANQLDLTIAEIEGDAVFFYRFGEAPAKQDIMVQYEEMLVNFFETVNHLPDLRNRRLPLSLKMVVHYGDIAQYRIGRFDKLYGKVVTEAHLLLKNHVNSHSYVLMTNDYLRQVDATPSEKYYLSINQCEKYWGVRELCYSAVDYS